MTSKNLFHSYNSLSQRLSCPLFRFPLPLRERARVRGNIHPALSRQSAPLQREQARSATIRLTAATLVAAISLWLPKSIHAAALDETLGKRIPEARIDLGTKAGTELVKAQWRYSDTKIIEVDFKAVGADGQPSTTPNKTYDITPHAGRADFDDSNWEVIEPTNLDKRRTNGRLSFNWYRIKITVPERIGNFDPTGSTVVFATSLDDYAEIWVDGELPRATGQSGGSVIKGWNAANRLVVGRGVKPGQTIQFAIFGVNGPLSQPPTNYIWMRYAAWNSTKSRPDRLPSRRRKSTSTSSVSILPSMPSCRSIRRSLNSPKVFNSPRVRSGSKPGYSALQ